MCSFLNLPNLCCGSKHIPHLACNLYWCFSIFVHPFAPPVVHFRARTWLCSQKYGCPGRNTRIRAQCSAGLLVSLTCRPPNTPQIMCTSYILVVCFQFSPSFTMVTSHIHPRHLPVASHGPYGRAGGVVMETAMATFLMDGWLFATRRGATQHKPSHPRPLPWARADFCGYVAHPPAPPAGGVARAVWSGR